MILLAFTARAQESLEEYKGVYKFREGSPTPSVEVSVQDGNLYASSTIGSAALARVGKDTFSIPDYSGMMYFYRNDKGVVISTKVEVNNLVLEGEKQSAGIVNRESAIVNRRVLVK